MRIQFISQNIEHVSTPQGGYDKMTVTFKNLDSNKVEVKSNIMSFTFPDVFARLKEGVKDELFQITMAKGQPNKDGKSFWNWTEVHRDDGTAPAPVETPRSAAPAKTNTYDEKNKLDRERFEFDKEKQTLIIRQSCLSSAVDLCKDHGKQPNPDQVIQVAAVFENYVWGRGIAGMTDDIPS